MMRVAGQRSNRADSSRSHMLNAFHSGMWSSARFGRPD